MSARYYQVDVMSCILFLKTPVIGRADPGCGGILSPLWALPG